MTKYIFHLLFIAFLLLIFSSGAFIALNTPDASASVNELIRTIPVLWEWRIAHSWLSQASVLIIFTYLATYFHSRALGVFSSISLLVLLFIGIFSGMQIPWGEVSMKTLLYIESINPLWSQWLESQAGQQYLLTFHYILIPALLVGMLALFLISYRKSLIHME